MTIPNVKALAKQYAAAGYPVLLTWGIKEDGSCACGEPHTGKGLGPSSKGKHPYHPTAPNGVLDATTDLEVIERWPDGDLPCNLGIAGTMQQVTVDFDNGAIANALFALMDDPDWADRLTVSKSGRDGGGGHAYFWSENGCPNVTLKNLAGTELGSIQGFGRYVMAPESMHYSGRRYKWVGDRELLTSGPTRVADVESFLRTLIEECGSDLAPWTARVGTAEVPIEGEVKQFQWPWQECMSAPMTNLLHPLQGGTNRHTDSFALACEIIRVCKAFAIAIGTDGPIPISGKRLTWNEFAGVLKWADVTRNSSHPEGPKFAGRKDGGAAAYAQQIRLALEAIEAESTPQPEPTPIRDTGGGDGDDDTPEVTFPDDDPEMPSGPAGGLLFYYTDALLMGKPISEVVSGIIDNRNKKIPKLVCNFGWKTVALLERPDGSGVDWEVKAFLPKQEPIRFIIPHEAHTDTRKFMIAVNTALPITYHVHAESAVLRLSLVYLSGTPPLRKRLVDTGWTEDGYVLPGRHLLTANGYDPVRKHEPVQPVSGALAFFGRGVDPMPDVDLTDILRLVFTLREPEVILPILLQLFGSCLTSLGLGSSPGLLHTVGETGTGKTGTERVLLSLYGVDWAHRDSPLASWAAARPGGVEVALFQHRDLPVVLDNYKVNVNTKGVTDIIHKYADHGSGLRAGGDMTARESLPSRGLLMSTGESPLVLDSDLSSHARVINVIWGLSREDFAAYREKLVALTRRAAEISSLGYEWLRHLAGILSTLPGRLRDLEDLAMESIKGTALEGRHGRFLGTLSPLMAVSVLLDEFIAAHYPLFLEEYREIRRTGLERMVLTSAETAVEAEAHQTDERFLNWLRDAALYGTHYFAPKDPYGAEPDYGYGVQDNLSSSGYRGVLAGYHGKQDGENWFFVRESKTWGEFRAALVRGQEPVPPLGWNGVTDLLKKRGLKSKSVRIMGGTAKWWAIPYSLVVNDGSGGTEEASVPNHKEDDRIFD